MSTKMEKVYIDTFGGVVECEMVLKLNNTNQTLVIYKDRHIVVDNQNIVTDEEYIKILEDNYKVELKLFNEYIKSRKINKDMILKFIKDL